MRELKDPAHTREARRAETAAAAARAYNTLTGRYPTKSDLGRFQIIPDPDRRLVRVVDLHYHTDFLLGVDGTARALHPGTDVDKPIPPTATEIEILLDEIREQAPLR